MEYQVEFEIRAKAPYGVSHGIIDVDVGSIKEAERLARSLLVGEGVPGSIIHVVKARSQSFVDVYRMISKIIGPVTPVGDTNIDTQRFENLGVLSELISRLVCDVINVSKMAKRQEFSMKKSGELAEKFLKQIGEDINEVQS